MLCSLSSAASGSLYPPYPVVLTSIRNPDFRQISIAYANYILSYHNFIGDIKPIVKAMATEAIEEKKYRKFKKIFKTYEILQVNILLNTLLDSSDIFYEGSKDGELQINFSKNVSNHRKKQILKKLNMELLKTNVEHQEFLDILKIKVPNNFFLAFPYKFFLKRHTKRIKQKLIKEKFEN